MEANTEKPQRQARSKGDQDRSSEKFEIDWIEVGGKTTLWLLQGAALALGGLIVNHAYNSFSSESVMADTDKVVPFRRAGNA